MITLAAVMHVYEVRPRKDKRGVESAMNFQSHESDNFSRCSQPFTTHGEA